MIIYTLTESYEIHIDVKEPKPLSQKYRIEILQSKAATGEDIFGFRTFIFEEIVIPKPSKEYGPGGFIAIRHMDAEFQLTSIDAAKSKANELVNKNKLTHTR